MGEGIIKEVEYFQFASAGNQPQVVVVARNDLAKVTIGAGGDVVEVSPEDRKFFAVEAVEAVLRSKPQEAFFIGGYVYDAVLGKTVVDVDRPE